jgi:archaellum component FlaG (FlaF/FlaG flagellin family)
MSTISFSPTYAARPIRVARPAAPQLRLTRRGRLTVFVLALLFAAAIAFVLAGGSSASNEPASVTTATERIVVTPGQTLWQIAADRAADGEVRDMVDAIEKLNALEEPVLYVGQELFVPAS